jgi:hypothetical protein
MKRLIDFFKRKNENPVGTVNSTVISLSPRVITDPDELIKIQPYLDELSASLSEPSITNIALAGTYGSGKSTIIKTFQARNPQFKYLNVSLASFKDNEDKKHISKKEEQGKEGEQVDNNNFERRLEISILQQIFYHVKPSKIPDSRFKRINNTTNWKLFFVIGSFILWIISVLLLFKYGYIDNLNPKTWDTDFRLSWFSILLFVIFFGGIGLFAKFIIRLFGNSKINKFSIKGEVELGDKIDKSVFNEHLEEIVYFFERTDFDVVVIEDLDRFESTDIFTKLREINLILNGSELIKRKNGVNFLYAIKDEMFTDKSDRVKFFDYIVPVIPFINASNADAQLQKLIENKNLRDVLSADFVCDIVTFIDDIDMRLLINIVQEFCIYRNNILNVNADKLFAMIIYKNLFPDDFGLLGKRNGDLFDFLHHKQRYVQNLISSVENDIIAIQTEKNNILREGAASIKELKAVYITAIHKAIPNAISVNIEGETIDFYDLLDDTYFNQLKSAEDISINSHSRYNNTLFSLTAQESGVSFNDVEKIVNPIFSYNERMELIENRNNDRISKLDTEIKMLKNRKLEIKDWSIMEIFKQIDIEPHLEAFKGKTLMRSLLINGYIDEDYDDYISLFHAVLITHNDHKFEKSIKSDNSLPFDYELTKIENLLKRIPDKYFKRETILNFKLLDYLIEHYDEYNGRYKMIIETLSSGSEKSGSFVRQYVERRNHLDVFVKHICANWSGFFDLFLDKLTTDFENASGFSKARILWDAQQKFESFINKVDVKDIVAQDANKRLTSFLNESYAFFQRVDRSTHTKLQEIFKLLKIRLRRLLPPDDNNMALFDYVVNNYHYVINDSNLRIILEAKIENFDPVAYQTANYTTIRNSKIKTLIDYANVNIGQYLNSVYLKLEENANESEESVLLLLNNDKIDLSQKTEVLSCWNGKIKVLAGIADRNVQQKALELSRIEPTWQNIYAYYDGIEDGELDDTLLGFLDTDDNAIPLSEQKIVTTEEREEEFIKKLSLAIINRNEISDENYARLIKATKYAWNSLNFENLDRPKVENMVDTKFLSFTQSNFDKLKEHFPNLHIRLAVKHSSTLIAKYDEMSFESADIHKLLVSPNISKNVKVQLIDKLSSPIFETKEVAVAACDILIEADYIAMEYSALENMIKFATSTEKRVRLINIHFGYLDNTQLKGLVGKVGDNYKRLFMRQNKPKFPITDYNRILFQNMLDQGLIGKFVVSPRDESEYRVSAKY